VDHSGGLLAERLRIAPARLARMAGGDLRLKWPETDSDIILKSEICKPKFHSFL
jgi:hypothetical protein